MAIKDGTTAEFNLKTTRFKMFCVGDNGSGKTWFGSTLPKPYWINLNDGLLTVGGARGLTQPYCRPENESEVRQVIMEIADGKRATNRESIILDCITDLTPILVAAQRIRGGKDLITIQGWGIIVDHLREIIKAMVDLHPKRNVLVLSQQQIVRDELQGMVMGLPDTVGRFATTVRGFFDLCFYSEAIERFSEGQKIREWVLHTISAQGGIWKGTDKTGKLPPEVPNDFEAIFKYITGGTSDEGVHQVQAVPATGTVQQG